MQQLQFPILHAKTRSQFVFGGKSTFTLKSLKTGKHYTYKVNKHHEKDMYFVSLLVGPNNRTDYMYIGYIFGNNPNRFHRKLRISESPATVGIEWFLKNLHTTQIEMYHEGRCCKCNRKLTTPESITFGIGPECRKRGA